VTTFVCLAKPQSAPFDAKEASNRWIDLWFPRQSHHAHLAPGQSTAKPQLGILVIGRQHENRTEQIVISLELSRCDGDVEPKETTAVETTLHGRKVLKA
jgi:hypothetical protein